MFYMPFDFFRFFYGVTGCLLAAIVLGIFAHRQIGRLRANNARNKPNVNVPFSKRAVADMDSRLDQVQNLRLSYQPRFTDITTISQHNNTPYVNRMIAMDEIAIEIDGLMAKLDGELARQPAESTADYLTRLRVKIPSLTPALCYRIAFLHEAAKSGPQKFDLEQLMELRSLINQFVKTINSDGIKANQSTPNKNLVTSFYNKLNTSASQRRPRNKFGGSDGGRLLAGNVAEEQIALLPVSPDSRNRMRRQSDSHRSLIS